MEIPWAIKKNGEGLSGRFITTTYQPRSSPPDKKLQSPFFSQSHPPRRPLPFQSTAGMSSGLVGFQLGGSLLTPSGGARRLNTDREQVKHLKSSSVGSFGIRPVRIRPIHIMEAACVQISSALGLAGSLSQAVMIRLRVYASLS
jgi:hypothetical protein